MSNLTSDVTLQSMIELSKEEVYIYVFWLTAIICVGCPINLYLIRVIYRTKKLHSVHNALMVNLCFCNAFTATLPPAFTLVALIYNLNHHTYLETVCYLRHVTIYAGLFPTFITLMLLAFEQYDAIVHPFTSQLSLCRLKIILLALWVINLFGIIVVSLEYWLYDDKRCFLKTNGPTPRIYYALTMGTFFLMLFTALYWYSRIIYALRKHQKACRDVFSCKQKRMERRPLQMVAVFIITFLAVWLPTGAVRILRSTTGKSNPMWFSVYVATGVFMYCTTIIHPVTFLCMSTQLKRAATLKRKDQSSITTMSSQRRTFRPMENVTIETHENQSFETSSNL